MNDAAAVRTSQSPAPAGHGSSDAPLGHSIKELLTSIVISFVMAFIFRGFVMEAYLIPTGSMAPTLLGAHMRFRGPESSYSWAVGPWDVMADGMTPLPYQGGLPEALAAAEPGANRNSEPVTVHDPMTGEQIKGTGIKTCWGDRIFVFKYLYSIFDPQRFDVVVFRNPRDPSVNFIKRLIGLPGEMVALVDGDVFVRRAASSDDPKANTWSLPGWSICRKPDRAQLAMWQQLFSSEYTPLNDTSGPGGSRWFVSPWIGVNTGPEGKDWRIEGRRTYEYTGKGPTRLLWNSKARTIDDSYAYNESPRRASLEYPVSDVRVTAGFKPATDGQRVTATLEARGHTFRATVKPSGEVEMSMGPGRGAEAQLGLMHVTQERLIPLEAGRNVDLDFWFVDQTLQVWSGGSRVASAAYEWTPEQRVQFAMNASLDDVAAGPEFMTVSANYTRPEMFLDFDGGAFELSRVGLWRDVHYQADMYRYHSGDDDSVHSRAHEPALATHPTNTPSLTGDEFFVCGDNSPQSLDGRLWDRPSPWVRAIDAKAGVVHRNLLIGKAFYVYFPAPFNLGRIPIPDFGRMRLIW